MYFANQSSSHAERVELGVLARRPPSSPGFPPCRPKPSRNRRWSASGHAEQVGDHEHGERLGVRADELAPAVGDELVELLVGEAPHELLVLLEPLRRDQPHQQRALPRVLRRVHRDHVLVHRELVAVARRSMSLTSSPSSGTGNVANGPTTELHDENVSVSR